MTTHKHIAEIVTAVALLIGFTAGTAAAMAYAQGKREAIASFGCPIGPPGEAYMRTDLTKGEVVCIAPRTFDPGHSKVEKARIAAAQRRMGTVR